MRFDQMMAPPSSSRKRWRRRATAVAALIFLVGSAFANAADDNSATESDRCKLQFRQFSADMAVIVDCDLHTAAPNGLPAFSPECFQAISNADKDAIVTSAKKEARDGMLAVGKSQWCSDAVKTGRFLAGSPFDKASAAKPDAQGNGGQSKPESPVPGFACPNPHPLGELENANCVAPAGSEACRAADKYNVSLAQFKARHPDMDSARKEFDRRKAVDFGCFKSLIDKKHPDLDSRDVLREAEAAYFAK